VYLGDTRIGLLLVTGAVGIALAFPVDSKMIGVIPLCRACGLSCRGKVWDGGGDCDSREEEGGEHTDGVHGKSCLFVCGFIFLSFGSLV
jgi:hypothetical protein